MIFTIMMLACSGSSLTLSLKTGKNGEAIPTQFMAIYFIFMLFISGLSLFYMKFLQNFAWIQYFNIPHYGFTALQHNEFLGQNFCPEHNTAELSTCPNYV
ncbi:hypothetical protein A6R68_11673, partial [Neotoma lepida]